MRLVDLVSGPMQGIANIAGEATKKLNETTGAAARLGKGGAGGGDFFGKLKSGVSGFSKELGAAAGEVPGLNRALELVTNPYVAVTAGVVGVGLALKNATGRAMDFERGMAKINTTARLSRPELDNLRNQLLTMGADSTVPLAEIPDAFNQIISAVGNSKDALAMFGPALKASQAGFTDIRTVADSLTNVMGSVGNALPTDVLNTLFATVRLGKGEFKDFAQYLPTIIPLANNVKIGYQEVAGAFALMTAKGQKAEAAATGLRNIMSALGKTEVIYGSKSAKGFQQSGVAIFDQHHRMRKLVDIVGDLRKETAGLNDEQKQKFMAGLGLDVEATSAFSVLMQNSKLLREFVKGTTKSAGEMDAAYKRSLNPADKLKILLNQWDLVMTKIGYKILPYVNTALEWGLGVVAKIKAHSEGIGNYFGAAVAPIRLMWSGLKGVWNVLTWISDLGGGSMGTLIEQLFGGSSGVWQEIKGFLGNFFDYLNVALGAIDDVSEGHFEKASKRMDAFGQKMDRMRGGAWSNASDFMGVKGKSADFSDFFGLATKRADDQKNSGAGPLTTALGKQNKGADIQGDSSKARIVNTRIDKIEVNVKVADAAGRGMEEIGRHVTSLIVGSVRDSEIILSSGN